MRNMSFALTTAQILNRSKTVTRRLGWTFLKPGDQIQAVEKGMGLRKGEKARKLAVICVTSVQTEKLFQMGIMHDRDECAREGFPLMSAAEFIRMFMAANDCDARTPVTRIEFSYVDEPF